MNWILNQLIKLQELHHALSEQTILDPKVCLPDLETSINTLTEELPQQTATLYQRLQQRYAAAVVPERDGTCPACGMSLPSSQIPELRAEKVIQRCPNCGRILYHLEGGSRQMRRDLDRTEKPRAGVGRFLCEELMLPRIKAQNRDDAISELIHLMAEKGFVENPQNLLAAALQREAIASTALEHGLAFPHVRGVEGGVLTFSLGLKKRGLKFDPCKDRLTRVIFFFVIPTAASAVYLRFLSGLIETFRDSSVRKQLLGCKTCEEMWTNLRTLTQKTIP